jgi:hypothetical protein
VSGSPAATQPGPSAPAYGVGDQSQQLRRQADHYPIIETHIALVETPAHDLAPLVQPGEQHRMIGDLDDLLNPAEQ